LPVLLGPLKLAFSLGLGLVVVLLVSWSIDWVYVSRVWPDGADRLRSLLAADLGHGIAPARRRGLQIQALQANAGPLRTAPQARPGPPVLSLAEYV